ncbi:hypothetical protein E2C01_057356 [Portunus trituberculatus]
MCEP